MAAWSLAGCSSSEGSGAGGSADAASSGPANGAASSSRAAGGSSGESGADTASGEGPPNFGHDATAERDASDAGAAPDATQSDDAAAPGNAALADASAATAIEGSTACTGGSFPDAFEAHNLQALNAYRSDSGLSLYALDVQLSIFACAGSNELSVDHTPHEHFIMNVEAGTLLDESGFKNAAGENQGDPHGWVVEAENTQIDQILAAMYAEGPDGGHYQNMMSTMFKRVGVGLLEVDGGLYFTNDFSN
jgi:uncharacterized protein YkwD